jgi:uncharacterized protein (TIGR03083 family)
VTSPDPARDPRIAALRASHDRLVSVAGPLGPEEVRGPAYPSKWTVAQVLSHLGSGAEIQALTLEAGLAGGPAVPREAYPPIWDRWNAKSPEEQAADGLAADAAFVSKVEANAGTDATFEVWSGPVDIGGFAESRLSELAVHTWDVAVALDPTATVVPDAVPFVLDGLGRLVGFAAKPSSWTGLVRVTTVDPARDVALRLGEESSLAPWRDGDDPDATLVLPAEAFVRLVYGRLDPDHTPPGTTADGLPLDTLRTVFQGF